MTHEWVELNTAALRLWSTFSHHLPSFSLAFGWCHTYVRQESVARKRLRIAVRVSGGGKVELTHLATLRCFYQSMGRRNYLVPSQAAAWAKRVKWPIIVNT
eukprot:GHVN01105178.1.p2 GENE.GHVN01105178.1~~GHVN01105178.1.p2  ORF type:complete len:101 (+),score=6.76 GHVN01105178.1:885-1187(+)